MRTVIPIIWAFFIYHIECYHCYNSGPITWKRYYANRYGRRKIKYLLIIKMTPLQFVLYSSNKHKKYRISGQQNQLCVNRLNMRVNWPTIKLNTLSAYRNIKIYLLHYKYVRYLVKDFFLLLSSCTIFCKIAYYEKLMTQPAIKVYNKYNTNIHVFFLWYLNF